MSADDRLDSPSLVAREYATAAGLCERNRAYRQFRRGPDAELEALAVIRLFAPTRFLEVGCGTGEFSARVTNETHARVIAVDLSAAMVETARQHGVDARVADVQALPFETANFDCVFAGWVLYHVPDIGRSIHELARVLRPDGLAIITTHSNERGGKDLMRLLGQTDSDEARYSFSAENGQELLAQDFGVVERRDLDYSLAFPNGHELRRYVEALPSRKRFADRVPATYDPISIIPHGITMFVARQVDQ
jgi:SAM-dependent methyltransferase